MKGLQESPGSWVKGLDQTYQGLGLRVSGWSLGFRASGFGLEFRGLAFRV